jgi:hypothetical protein
MSVRSLQLQVQYSIMGNCLSIKVDKERRVWVRRRRQRSDQLRQQKPYTSHGTIYSEARPRKTQGHRHRRRSPKSPRSSYFPVTPSGQPMLWPPNINATQQYPIQPIAPTQQMPTQAIPTQQNATQPVFAQQTTSQQPATGMDPDMARSLLQDP